MNIKYRKMVLPTLLLLRSLGWRSQSRKQLVPEAGISDAISSFDIQGMQMPQFGTLETIVCPSVPVIIEAGAVTVASQFEFSASQDLATTIAEPFGSRSQ